VVPSAAECDLKNASGLLLSLVLIPLGLKFLEWESFKSCMPGATSLVLLLTSRIQVTL
jgi:hypothetical protein